MAQVNTTSFPGVRSAEVKNGGWGTRIMRKTGAVSVGWPPRDTEISYQTEVFLTGLPMGGVWRTGLPAARGMIPDSVRLGADHARCQGRRGREAAPAIPRRGLTESPKLPAASVPWIPRQT